MSNFDAWASGFFDGEGCIVVSISSGKGQVWTSLHVTVTQMDREPLILLKEKYGGNIVTGKTQNDDRKRRTIMFRWQIYNDEAVKFLTIIRDYSIVKKQEIDLALQWPSGGWRGAWNPMPEWAKRKRYKIRAGLKGIRAKRRDRAAAAFAAHDQEKGGSRS